MLESVVAAHAISDRSTTTENKCRLLTLGSMPSWKSLGYFKTIKTKVTKAGSNIVGRWKGQREGDGDRVLGCSIYNINFITLLHIIFFVIFSKLFTSRNFTNREGKVISKFYHKTENCCWNENVKEKYEVFIIFFPKIIYVAYFHKKGEI